MGLQTSAQLRKRPLLEGFLRVGFWICIVIAVLVVIRRIVALALPSSAPSATAPFTNLDAVFASHAALTLAHIIPALCFVVITPVVVFGKGSGARMLEKVLFPLGVIVGLTAYAMSAYAVGGWIERSAVLAFNSYFLFCLARAWNFRLSGDAQRKRRWLLRGIATLLGIGTTRPVMAVFFATSRLTHWQPSQFFGIAFWIGFSINVLLVEVWIQRTMRTWHSPAAQVAGSR